MKSKFAASIVFLIIMSISFASGCTKVPVASVSLDPTSLTLTIGETSQLTAAILPENATNKAVTWNSDNTEVATVAEGLVTAVGAGNAVITVTTDDGGHTATCTITVNLPVVPVAGVSLDTATLSLALSGTHQLVAAILPLTATNTDVNWTSSNNSVATVSPAGLVTAMGAGNAVITATTIDGGHTATCEVTVNIAVSGVTLNKTTASLALNGTVQLVATVSPTTASNKNVVWSSSNSYVAQVSPTGLVTAKGSGSAVITVATVDGDKQAQCAITIAGAPRGNTVGNITNGGLVAFSGKKTYLTGYQISDGIYTVNTDHSLQLVVSKQASWLNVYNNIIYFANLSDGGKLYSYNPTSTLVKIRLVKINDHQAQYINVVDGWIYYANASDNNSIYRKELGNTNPAQKLAQTHENCHYLNVVDNWVYYSTFVPSPTYGWAGDIYRMRVDGTGREKIGSDKGGKLSVVEGYVYYCNASDGDKLYRIGIDGANRQKLNDDICQFLNVDSQWVYYIKSEVGGGTLYRMRHSGTGREQYGSFGMDLHVANGWFYYMCSHAFGRMPLDGNFDTDFHIFAP